MSQSISSELLAELSIATFERVAAQQFKIVGQIPAWLQRLKPNIFGHQDQVNLSELFPFLEYFLADPSSLWPPNPEKTIKSGLWSEQGPLEQTLYLEATALQVGTQEILLIAAQNADIEEKIALIQTARENALSYLSDRKHNSQELVSSTFYDSLTGLPNQTYFSLQLTQSFESCRQNQACQAAVLEIAIDQLNLVSGSLGYTASEQLLTKFAWRLKASLASDDAVLARSEGAEFVLLLPYVTSRQQIIELANDLLTALKPPFLIDSQEIFISTSMGVAISRTEHNQAPDLLCDAHTALQQAKSQGGSLVVLFEPAMQHQTVRQFQIENDLHHAIGDQELQVHYQPIVTIGDQQVIGFEAFVRWFHPHRGAIAPLSFLPVAESVGLMSAVDLWLIREACFRIQQWQKMMPRAISISVNLSAHQLEQSQLPQQIELVLKETNIDPQSLKLEFNEQVLLNQLEALHPVLEQLDAVGVQLCIDGFSGSYAALNALPQLPIRALKLDPACLGCLTQQPPQYRALMTGAIQLAHDLEMEVIAKGVEDQEQLQALTAVGCDYAQGYFFSGPLNGARATQLLHRNQA
jgi:diguanylate cyclase (GGDEF)-like protein